MSFNKCYLTKEKILNVYESRDLNGVIKFLRSYDAFFTDNDQWLNDMIDKYHKGKLSDSDFKNKEINEVK